MLQILAEDLSSYATMKELAAELKQCRDSTEDYLHSGRPKISTTDKQVDAIHHTVLDDRRPANN